MLNLPPPQSVDDLFSAGGKTWKFDGATWSLLGATADPQAPRYATGTAWAAV